MKKTFNWLQPLLLFSIGFGLGYWVDSRAVKNSEPGLLVPEAKGQSQRAAANKEYAASTSELHLLQSPGAVATNRQESDYGLGDSFVTKLLPYPPGGPGT